MVFKGFLEDIRNVYCKDDVKNEMIKTVRQIISAQLILSNLIKRE